MALSLLQAHAMVKILAWMICGSTGILFARYGRSIRFGIRRQCLGKAIWFQMHRFLLSITSLFTLLGFLLILVRNNGRWVDPLNNSLNSFIHSILGGIIVCCVILQIWLALYRCHPQSRFRFIFDWSHRIVGLLAFALAIPTILLMTIVMSKSRPALLPIVSCWSAWIIIIIMIFEKIQHQLRATVLPIPNQVELGDTNQKNNNRNARTDTEAGTNTNVGSQRLNQIKLLLLFIHIIVSVVLSIVLIVFITK